MSDLAISQINNIQNALSSAIKQIKSVIANGITPEKMARVVVNELSGNKKLRDIASKNQTSLIRSVIQSSQLGLEIGGHLGHSYLVPYGDEVTLIVGYRGLLALARRSGQISSICAEVVYEKDEFDLSLGLNPSVCHKPFLKGDRGQKILAYMVAKFKDGGSHFEWMTIDEVYKIRDNSKAYSYAKSKGIFDTPWISNEDEMIRKTVLRRGWKYLPMSIEMQNAFTIDTASEIGKKTEIIEDSVVILDNVNNDVDGSFSDKTPPPKTFTFGEFEAKKQDWKNQIEFGLAPQELIEKEEKAGKVFTESQKKELFSFQAKSNDGLFGGEVKNETI